MNYDYKTVLEYLDYPQRFAYTNPLTDKGKKVRWGVSSKDFTRLLKLVSKLPPADAKHTVRFVELYKDPEGDMFIFLVEEKKTMTEKSTY
jgi:hypothetical protein